MTSTVLPGRGPLWIATQALRAWLLSACPSGTKATPHLSDLTIILALMGFTLGDAILTLRAVKTGAKHIPGFQPWEPYLPRVKLAFCGTSPTFPEGENRAWPPHEA
jgi:hypothetical protein